MCGARSRGPESFERGPVCPAGPGGSTRRKGAGEGGGDHDQDVCSAGSAVLPSPGARRLRDAGRAGATAVRGGGAARARSDYRGAVLCLTTATDPGWAERAVDDLPALLADHAHCEMKAASNALSLAARLPEHPAIARALVALAQEELAHYDAVLAELMARSIRLPPPEVDAYAAELRAASRRVGKPPPELALADRFLVAALIEARSCERLGLLAKALAGRGEQALAAFYDELFASEARHYKLFVDLAIEVSRDEASARARLGELAAAEGAIAAKLGRAPAVHG